MPTKSETRTIDEAQITDPTMSQAPRRVTKTRAALLVLLVLGALAFARAVYLDNSKGSLTDEQGIISDS